MNLAEYASLDACAIAEGIRAGDFTAKEVRASAVGAIAQVNDDLNAVVELFEDRAEAGDPDADLRGCLAGVPFMLKDAGATDAGRLQEKGSRLMQGFRPRSSSAFTTMCRAEGLINLGRTTTPEGALAGTTESVATGKTRNPYDLNLSTGGSSGGAAALVAAGALPLAHGNDGAGSIRMPASLCGVVGLKPSRGRVSVGPAIDEIAFGVVSEFFLTRTVRDAALGLNVVAKTQSGEPFAISRGPHCWVAALKHPIAGLRIGYTTTNWRTGLPVDREVAAVVAKTLSILEALGCPVEDEGPEFDHEPAYRYNAFCFDSLAVPYALTARKRGLPFDDQVVEPVMLSAYERFKRMSSEEVFWILQSANAVRRQIGRFFERFDILVTPTTPTTRIPLDTLDCSSFTDVEAFREANERLQFAFTCPFNITGQPAISLPLGWAADGFPIGVQLVAGVADEETLLAVASALEEALPWTGHRPSIHAAAGIE